MNIDQRKAWRERETNLELPELFILWAGDSVHLLDKKENQLQDTLSLGVKRPLAHRVVDWCLKNGYRCPQVDLTTDKINI